MIAHYVAILIAFLVSVSVHEFAHALTATLLGDPTPRQLGRLTLNPFTHIDPTGLFFLLLFRIGWARPVPFNPRYFVRQRFGTLLTAFAGPTSNFLLALMSLYALKYVSPLFIGSAWHRNIVDGMRIMGSINVMLGVFNMLPIPPLDGSHLLQIVLRDISIQAWYFVQKFSLYFLLIIFMIPSLREMLVGLVRTVENSLWTLVL
jgi:Zn-dependent protease